MDPIDELLQSLSDAPDQDHVVEVLSDHTDGDLGDARDELVEALDEATSGDTVDLEAARSIRQAIDMVDTEAERRIEAAQNEEDEAAELRDGILDDESSANPDEGDTDSDGDGEDVDTDAEDTDDAEDTGDADTDDAEEEDAGPLAADLAAHVASQRDRRREREQEVEEHPNVVVAGAGPAVGTNLGVDSNLSDVADLFARYAPQVTSGRQGIVHIEKDYPDDRHLGMQADENTRLVEAVTSPRAIVAAGGICDPIEADFDHPIFGDRSRPIRDALPSFQATRGGIRFAPAATVADLEPAITVWSEANDTTPGSDGPATKAALTVTCETEQEARVDAVAAVLQVGNFQARFNPEFWQARLDLMMVAHDRVAEQRLLATIDTESTAVTGVEVDGTLTNVLGTVDKMAAGIRSRLRLSPETTIRMIAPAWLPNALQNHLAHANHTVRTEAYASSVAEFFTARNIEPILTPDDDVFATQTSGAIEDWPGGDVHLRMFPEGSFLFLDGGTLDLGTQIVDSTLNETNDRQAFMETFERAVFRGAESFDVTVPVSEDCICSAEAA